MLLGDVPPTHLPFTEKSGLDNQLWQFLVDQTNFTTHKRSRVGMEGTLSDGWKPVTEDEMKGFIATEHKGSLVCQWHHWPSLLPVHLFIKPLPPDPRIATHRRYQQYPQTWQNPTTYWLPLSNLPILFHSISTSSCWWISDCLQGSRSLLDTIWRESQILGASRHLCCLIAVPAMCTTCAFTMEGRPYSFNQTCHTGLVLC